MLTPCLQTIWISQSCATHTVFLCPRPAHILFMAERKPAPLCFTMDPTPSSPSSPSECCLCTHTSSSTPGLPKAISGQEPGRLLSQAMDERSRQTLPRQSACLGTGRPACLRKPSSLYETHACSYCCHGQKKLRCCWLDPLGSQRRRGTLTNCPKLGKTNQLESNCWEKSPFCCRCKAPCAAERRASSLLYPPTRESGLQAEPAHSKHPKLLERGQKRRRKQKE